MMASIKQWFAPPIFEGDEEKTRRARLLNAILIVVLIFMSLVILAELIDKRMPMGIIVANGISVLSAFLLQRWLK